MLVYVVVSVYAGVGFDVKVFQNEEDANQALIEDKKELGIVDGMEEESEHDVSLSITELK